MISLATHFSLVTLSPDVVNISFRHRKEISRVFNDVLGLHDIDHVSIDIVNAQNELIYFSTTPSMGYNLISSNMWLYDGSISPTFFKSYSFYYWDQTYHQNFFDAIKKIKETEHGFSFGFTLVRKVNGFYILYSFATRGNTLERKLFFQSHVDELLKIGDFCYKSIRSLYALYYDEKSPTLTEQPLFLTTSKQQTNIRLVVDNTR